MRKRIVSQTPIHTRSQSAESWLDLEEITTIEVTSEEPNFPIESALHTGNGPGWRALEKGEQQIRILFDRPTSLKRIRLRFVEPEVARTQEFTIRWSISRKATSVPARWGRRRSETSSPVVASST